MIAGCPYRRKPAPTAPEKLCESIDVKLNAYIEERQKELSGSAK
jgi:hypothetical protein